MSTKNPITLKQLNVFSVNGRLEGTIAAYETDEDGSLRYLVEVHCTNWSALKLRKAAVDEFVQWTDRSQEEIGRGVIQTMRLARTAEAEFRQAEQNVPRPVPRIHTKPTIKVKDPAVVQAPLVWEGIAAHNRPEPKVFRFGSRSMADLIPTGDRSRKVTRILLKNELIVLMPDVVDWIDYDRHGDEIPSDPPKKIIDYLLGQTAESLPQLNGLVSSPYCLPDGSIVIESGYNERSGFFMDGGIIDMGQVPERPTDDEVWDARELLIDDLFVDFPFVADADRAHAVTIALTCLVRPMFEGPTPLFVFNAPSEGTGKGLLPEVIGLLVTGRTPHLTTAPMREEEWRKEIPALLESAGSMVLIDNVTRRVDSAALASVLTSTNPSFRVMRTTTHQTLPNRLTWTMAGNNIDFSREIARRVVFIQLDAQMEDPSSRSDFKHSNLQQWTLANRERLLRALFVLIRNWISKGRPLSDVVFGSYETWAHMMGGILDAAEIPGFLENRTAGRSRTDESSNEWAFFVEVWWKEFRGQPVTAGKLVALASSHELMVEMRSSYDSHKATTVMGKALSKMRDRIFGQFAIRKAEFSGSRRHNEWCLQPGEPRS